MITSNFRKASTPVDVCPSQASQEAAHKARHAELYIAASYASKEALTHAQELSAASNLLLAKIDSEALQPADEDGERKPWPFGQTPFYAAGVKYYMSMLAYHIKGHTDCIDQASKRFIQEYNHKCDMKDSNDLARFGLILSEEVLLQG